MSKNSKAVIVHKHKHDTDFYDASTKEAKNKSLKKVFKANQEMEYYYDLEDFTSSKEECEEEIKKQEDLKSVHKKHGDDYEVEKAEEMIQDFKKRLEDLKEQKSLYDKAQAGDVVSMERLLTLRRDYEYEGFELKTLR